MNHHDLSVISGRGHVTLGLAVFESHRFSCSSLLSWLSWLSEVDLTVWGALRNTNTRRIKEKKHRVRQQQQQSGGI